MRATSFHCARHPQPPPRECAQCGSRMLGTTGRHVIGRYIATDGPPPDPPRTSDTLDGPERQIRFDVPRWPGAHPAMLHPLSREVLLYLLAPLSAPTFLGCQPACHNPRLDREQPCWTLPVIRVWQGSRDRRAHGASVLRSRAPSRCVPANGIRIRHHQDN